MSAQNAAAASAATVPSAAAEKVIVALDCSKQQALTLAQQLAGKAVWLKVGMTLYYAEGPAMVAMLKEQGYKVFVDLKLHDIPHQVRGAAASVVRAGADMLTVHAVGGPEMMRAAYEGAREAFAQPPALAAEAYPKLLGITVLTSLNANTLQQLGVVRPLEEQVASLASMARICGLDGVVASPQEASRLRALLGPQADIVTPGVRPAGASLDDQSRTATPASAIKDGASQLVIGRPITHAPNPLAAFQAICKEIEGSLS